jgi:hypothetical protein
MGWDRGRYYTRSRKVNGRVVREYVGGGVIGEAAALIDADRRALRAAAVRARQAVRDRLSELEQALVVLDELSDLLARAALRAAGYRQHKRGEWRRRREQAGD